MDVAGFVTVAVGTARALAEWHEGEGLPHGWLCPGAFSTDRAGRRVLTPPGPQGWATAYTAPEQSGPLPRGADERSDLYALGLMLYELLTGQLPAGPAHGPGAAQPPGAGAAQPPGAGPAQPPGAGNGHGPGAAQPPGELVEGLPAVLDQIIMRLLAHAPEQRYQTARGVAEDLERCREQLDSGHVTPFVLGSHDVPSRLLVGGRLYGREARLTRLCSAYDRVAAGGRTALACVTGDPGVGKSALVAAFATQVAAGGARVVAGAFDPYRRAAPYATLGCLLARLGAGLVAEDAAGWRSRLADAVGGCADTLVDLVPGLAQLLGGQPPAPDLPPMEARNRMHLAACRFLAAVASPDRPLVIVLDDLHHASVASLALLRHLLTDPDTGHLLVVGAYEPKAAVPGHPLTDLLRELGRQVTTVALRPLPDNALTELLVDALHTNRLHGSRLALAVAEKTGSNPLCVEQFLHQLREQDMLTYDPARPAWSFDLDRIGRARPADHPATLISGRLRVLPPDLRRLLGAAALIGDEFDCATLAAATGEPAAELPVRLRPAIRRQLLTLTGDGGYRWVHDQVRQAAVALTPGARIGELRLGIGRALLDALPADERGARLFELVGYFNATELIGGDAEQARVAELNLAAGRKARRHGALVEARAYFSAGLAVLPPDAWERWYDLASDLHVAAAQAEHLAGAQDKARQLLDLAMAHASVDLRRVELLHTHVNLPLISGAWDADVGPGMQGLRLLGIELPADRAAWASAAEAELSALRDRLAGLSADDITGLPAMTDRRALAATGLIAALLPSAQVRRQDWFAMLSATGVRLALDHGCAGASSVTFAFHGLVLADHGDDEGAALCQEVALRLLTSVPAPEFAARTKAVVALTSPPWFTSVESTVELFHEAYLHARERGDAQLTKANWILYHMHLFTVGTQLDRVAEEIDAVWRFLDQHGDDDGLARMANRVMDNVVCRLRGTTSEPPIAESPAEAGLAALARQGRLGYASTLSLTRMLAGAYILGDYAGALELARTVEAIEPIGRGRFTVADRCFYHALTLTALSGDATPEQRRAYAAKLDELQAALDDWAAAGPAAFGYRALLVSAERARLAGDVDQAVGRFTRTIGTAREHGFIHGEAIAAELGGRYALARDETDAAAAYLRRARACYEQWGAAAKVAEIDQILAGPAMPPEPAGLVDQLDMLTAVKAVHAISGELEFDKLLATLLELLMQQAGADRGGVLLPEPAGLPRLAALAEIDGAELFVTQAPGGGLARHLPAAVVAHTHRTGEMVVGGHDDVHTRIADPYLAAHHPASLLCAPIRRHDQLIAILYLEQRRLAGAFTCATLDRLEVVCAQAAIALENATIHARLFEANRILDATFNRLPVGLILLDPDLTVRRASPRAIQLTGLPIQPGTRLADLYDRLAPADPDTPCHEAALAAVAPDDAEPIQRVIVITQPDGGTSRLSASAIPLRDPDGRLLGVTLLVAEAD